MLPRKAPLSTIELVRISLYWLALAGLWAGMGFLLIQVIADRMICPAGVETAACAGLERVQLTPVVGDLRLKPEEAVGLVALVGSVVALVVQPLSAALSDYTRSRLGRRRPWILVGTALDVVFLIALANAQTFLAVAALVVLLQFSSNLAQGPFQGYVPDLVPQEQVGSASGLVGLMSVAGQLVGVAIAAVAVKAGNLEAGIIAFAVLEVATMLPAVFGVADRPVEMPQRTGSLLSGVRGALAEAWGHRSFVWLLVSRFFILMTTGTVVGIAHRFLTRSLGYSESEAATAILALLAITVGSAALVSGFAGRASDRYGRKRVIWAGCLIGAVGMAFLTLVPAQPEIAFTGVRFPLGGLAAIPIGIGAGMFIAVDWALLVDIIPRATAGRYMGISNVVTATAGAVAVAIAGYVMGTVTDLGGGIGLGPRVALALTLAWYAVGAWALRRVDPRPFEVQMTEAAKDRPPVTIGVS